MKEKSQKDSQSQVLKISKKKNKDNWQQCENERANGDLSWSFIYAFEITRVHMMEII